MKIIAVKNNKGGCGKSTSIINIAGWLAKEFGKRVLCIDADFGQASITRLLLYENIVGAKKENYIKQKSYKYYPGESFTLRDYFEKKCTLNQAIKPSLISVRANCHPSNKGIYVLPIPVEDYELEGLCTADNVKRLFDDIKKSGKYDYVLVDCAPRQDVFGEEILKTVCDSVIVPAEMDFLELDTVYSLMSKINNIRETTNPNLESLGILLTKVDKRKKTTREPYMAIVNELDSSKLPIEIPLDNDYRTYSAFGGCTAYIGTSSALSRAYQDLTRYIVQISDDREMEVEQ